MRKCRSLSTAARTSIAIFILISFPTTITYAKIDHASTSLALEKHNNDFHQNAVMDIAESVGVAPVANDNAAEADEHHRIVILVPQVIPAPFRSPYSERAKKPRKKKPQHPKKKPKHHYPHGVVPVVHSGKVIHAHHHHGHVGHGHSHTGKGKHYHKHYGKGQQKHSHYGVGRITHKHGAAVTVKPPHKPKHWSVNEVFNNNPGAGFGHPNYAAPQRPRYLPQQPQPQQLQPQQPPLHLQHQQQVLHHRAYPQPNFFSNAATASFGVDTPQPPPPLQFNNGVQPISGGGRYRTANDRRDFASQPQLAPPNVAAQLIQIRRIPSSSSEQIFDPFIDKDTRSSLTAAALAFGNENDNENENEIEEENENEVDANENENENENEVDPNENENEIENDNEGIKEEDYAVAAINGLDRAIGEASLAVPRRKSQLKRPFEDNFVQQFNNAYDVDGGNEASLRYATFVQPPLQTLSPRNRIVAFSDAYHYRY